MLKWKERSLKDWTEQYLILLSWHKPSQKVQRLEKYYNSFSFSAPGKGTFRKILVNILCINFIAAIIKWYNILYIYITFFLTFLLTFFYRFYWRFSVLFITVFDHGLPTGKLKLTRFVLIFCLTLLFFLFALIFCALIKWYNNFYRALISYLILISTLVPPTPNIYMWSQPFGKYASIDSCI